MKKNIPTFQMVSWLALFFILCCTLAWGQENFRRSDKKFLRIYVPEERRKISFSDETTTNYNSGNPNDKQLKHSRPFGGACLSAPACR